MLEDFAKMMKDSMDAARMIHTNRKIGTGQTLSTVRRHEGDSKYAPHQGSRERARRVRQMACA